MVNIKVLLKPKQGIKVKDSNKYIWDPDVAQSLINQTESFKDQAQTSATNAETYKNQAMNYADDAMDYASQAEDSATASENAKDISVSAKNEATAQAVIAVNAGNNAVTQANIATSKAGEAQTYSNNAKTSEDNAKASETNAKTSEDNAKTSETNASTSEANALAYKNSASDYASQSQASAQASEEAKDLSVIAMNEATSQATIATNASNNAVSQANIATSKAGESQTYASNAHNSETNAKTSEDNAKESEENAEDYKDRCEEILERLGTAIKIKGRVDSLDDLPTSGNLDGDAYLVGEEGLDSYPEYYWYQNHWEFLGTSGGGGTWGTITGTLSSQTDLQTALDGKQDTLIAGNGIDITDNTISANNIFVATYGTTTYAEITQALADGKTVIAKRTVSDGRTLYFDYSMEDSNHDYRFYTSAGSQIMYGITCTTSSAWGNNNLTFQKQLTAGDNITIDNNTISATDTTYTAGNGIAISNNKISNTRIFTITEDMVTVTTDETKGVAPYSTSYGYTNVEISADSGIEWVEGALYNFIIDTKLVVSSNYRNVRIRIGSSGDWKPLMGYSSTIASGSSYFVKAYTTIYQYKSVYQSGGALHVQTDNNSIYSYLVNTIPVGALKIDNDGYGVRYSLVFPTTPLSTIDERFSSLVKSSNSGTKKVAQTDLTFYADRHPQYLSSGSIAAGGVSASATYQDYTGMDLRYSVNTNETWVSVNKKVFLWLKDFNEEDMSFKADATIGNIFSIDKLATKFPNTMTGDVYIYFLGWSGATWYTLSPNFTQEDKIFKYTPSTGAMVELNAEEHAKKQDTLISGTNIKTVNNTTLLGSGNIEIKSAPDLDNVSISKNSSDALQTIAVIDNNSNAIKTWTGTLAQYNAITTKDANTLYNITDDVDTGLDILQTIYPVGSLYLTTNAICPLASLFGTWTLVSQDRVLQGAGSRGAVGTTLQESLPNIKGTLSASWGSDSSDTGAFKHEGNDPYSNWGGNSSWNNSSWASFDASRSSSTYQDNAPVQQNAYLINVYRRIA